LLKPSLAATLGLKPSQSIARADGDLRAALERLGATVTLGHRF